MPKYPEIKVKLRGMDGNAHSIMGRVADAMRKGGLTEEQVKEYYTDATSSDYSHLLGATGRYVTVI